MSTSDDSQPGNGQESEDGPSVETADSQEPVESPAESGASKAAEVGKKVAVSIARNEAKKAAESAAQEALTEVLGEAIQEVGLKEIKQRVEMVKDMAAIFTPGILKSKVVQRASTRTEELASDPDAWSWHEEMVSSHGALLAIEEGTVHSGFPGYTVSLMDRLAGQGPASELVVLDEAIALCEPNYGPGAKTVIIAKKDVLSAGEAGDKAQRTVLKTSTFQAEFDGERSMSGRTFKTLINEWRVGTHTCGECGHTGAVTTKPGGVTGVNLLIWAACTLVSCGFLIWMPLVFKSLRTPVFACTNCGAKIPMKDG